MFTTNCLFVFFHYFVQTLNVMSLYYLPSFWIRNQLRILVFPDTLIYIIIASQRNVGFYRFACVSVFWVQTLSLCWCLRVCCVVVISTKISLYGLVVVETGKTVLMKVKGFGFRLFPHCCNVIFGVKLFSLAVFFLTCLSGLLKCFKLFKLWIFAFCNFQY